VQGFKRFLEAGALYSKHAYVTESFTILQGIKIQARCSTCDGERTFSASNSRSQRPFVDADKMYRGQVILLRYACADCSEVGHAIALRAGEEGIEKIGQWPALSVELEKPLQRALGAQAPIFRKGLICERQSYGIGAFAYYRRVLEEVVLDLLGKLEDLFTDEDRERYEAQLEKVKAAHSAEDRLKLVSDFVPPGLALDGMNPLLALYQALSNGLHARTDQECLENAQLIREIMSLLFGEIERHRNVKKGLSDRVKKLLAKK
jgi:hypothetical protein